MESKVRAVLGPTNTGKTWLALDRMLSYGSGMIGFPLRLLARENYDKALKIKGAKQVALITGEEKIIPKEAKYFFCTTESMLQNKSFDFIGVDEIQMASDPDRGHVFTNHLLHLRGKYETMFMGSATIAPIIRMLIPKVTIETRDRLSTLRWSGKKTIDRLPPRSAVVSFSANDVYAIAELIKRQKGGTAIVLGALSPRTRNAQVAMYQNGEVDWIVATDAIGMGLNMDINHVAFAATKKFDGLEYRDLTTQELAQIAGRAGRGGNDGTFGITASVTSLDDRIVESVENHDFENIKFLFWRNTELNYSSIENLWKSLRKPPPSPYLRRPRKVEDEQILRLFISDIDAKMRLNNKDNIQLAWEVCRVPDFSKTHPGAHATLLRPLLFDLIDNGYIKSSWIEKQIKRISKPTDDLQRLLQHINSVRTLTYISYQKGWLSQADMWQEKTRYLEDKLSDKLHESLTNRFVDRKTSTLLGKLRQDEDLIALINNHGEITIENHSIGYLKALNTYMDKSSSKAITDLPQKSVQLAVNNAIRYQLDSKYSQFILEQGKNISIQYDEILWHGHIIAKIVKGDDILVPKISLRVSDLLKDEQKEYLQKYLQKWLHQEIEKVFFPIIELQKQAKTKVDIKGLAFLLSQGLGSVSQDKIGFINIGKDERKLLNRYGVKFGQKNIFVKKLIKPKAIMWRYLLWKLWREDKKLANISTEKFFVVNKTLSSEDANMLGFFLSENQKYAIRQDSLQKMIEIADEQKLSIDRILQITAAKKNLIVSNLRSFGFRYNKEEDKYRWKKVKNYHKDNKKEIKLDDENLSKLRKIKENMQKKEKHDSRRKVR